MPYKHFGPRLVRSLARVVFARWGALARLGRFDSCILYQQAHRISQAATKQRRIHQRLRDWQMRLCTRLLSETKQVRFLHPAPSLRTRALHSTGSGQSLLSSECRFESGSAFQASREKQICKEVIIRKNYNRHRIIKECYSNDEPLR